MPLVDDSEPLHTSTEKQPTGPAGLTHSPAPDGQRDEQPHDIPYIQTSSPSSTPVLRLPNELLGYIFRILFDNYYWAAALWRSRKRRQITFERYRDFYLQSGSEMLPESPGEKPQPLWTIILQVCHAWRSVALNYAGLLTQINTTNPGWIAHFSHASAQLPLDFELEIDGSPGGLHAAKLAGEQSIERARRLSIYAPPHVQMTSINNFLDRLLGQGAPKLRELKMDLRDLCEPYGEGETGHHELRLLGDELFLGCLPHLEDINIDCPFSFLSMQINCPAFRGLTRLIVKSKHAWQRSTTAEFLLCLQTWTQLRLLILESGLPTDVVGIPAFKSSTPVALPSISSITLVDESHLISSFMAHVSLKPSADVMFEFMMADKHLSLDENDFRRAAAVRLISQLFSEFAAAPLVHLELCCEGSRHPHTPDLRHINVSGSTVPLLEYEDGEDTEPLTLIFNIVDDPPVRAACLQTIFETIQLSHVKKLKFYAPDAYFLIDWSQVLSKLQDLRELIIDADLFGPLIEILGTAAAERSSGQAGSVECELYLPRLESLEIEQRRTDRDTFDLLGQALKNRRDWGSPLPRLCLFMHTWQLEADLEKALQESVGSLGIFTYVIGKGKKLEESSEESSEDGDDEHEGKEEDEDQSEDDMVGSQPDEDGSMDVDGGDEELGSRSDGQN